MSRRKWIVGVIVCALAVAAFQQFALLQSLADFHPGGDVEISERLRRRANLGTAMSQPFMVPLVWIMTVTGGYSKFILVIQWLVLPIVYGTFLFSLYALVRHALR